MNLKQRSISNCWCCTLVHSSGQPSKWIPKQVCHASPLKSKRVNKETSLSQTVQLLLPYSQPVFTCPTVSIPFPTVSMSSPALQSVCLSLPYSPLPYSQYVFPCLCLQRRCHSVNTHDCYLSLWNTFWHLLTCSLNILLFTKVGQNHIYTRCIVYTTFLAENSSNIWSYTVYIFGSGQL